MVAQFVKGSEHFWGWLVAVLLFVFEQEDLLDRKFAEPGGSTVWQTNACAIEHGWGDADEAGFFAFHGFVDSLA
jgi:hypothetical protein